jgi:hypothetical protein
MRLPDIAYNSGSVRPLAKEDTSLPLRAAQTEIGLSKVKLGAELDLSQARLGAELDKSSKIGQANIRLAREMRQVDQQAAWDRAKIATDIFSHGVDQKGADRSAKLQLTNTLVQTAINSAGKWYQGEQEAKAAQGSATYSQGIASLSATLQNSSTVDLNAYPDIDFSQIPANMIYEGVDEVTGQPIKTAPNHLAAPLVFAAEEKKIRAQASTGLDSQLAQAKFNNAIGADYERAAVGMIASKAKHEHAFLSGQYEDALTKRIDSADLAGAIDTINSAEARGVWGVEEASKKRKTIVGDVAYSGLVKGVDRASTMAELQAVKEAAYDLPKEYQTSIRAAVAAKEHDFEKAADKAQKQHEQAVVGLNKIGASQVAIAAGGLKDYGAGVAAIVEKYGKADPAHVDDYVSAWHTTHSTLISQENRQKDAAVASWYRDPSQAIPAWAASGPELREMEKYATKVKSGEPVQTHMPTYNKLQRMAGEDPASFQKLDLDLFRAGLDDGDMKHFAGVQSKMLEGGGKSHQVATANSVFDTAAMQVWGKEGSRSKAQQAQADGAFRAYTAIIEQRVEANGGKPLATGDMQKISDEVFKAKIPAMVPGTFYGVSEKKVTVADPTVAPYVPAITSMLQANRKPVSAAAIIKEYQAWAKAGRLEELK